MARGVHMVYGTIRIRDQTTAPRPAARLPKEFVARANRIALGSVLLFLALLGMLFWEQVSAWQSANQWLRHNHDVLGTAKDLALAVRDAEPDSAVSC